MEAGAHAQWLLSTLSSETCWFATHLLSSLGEWGGAACFIPVNELNPAVQKSTCMPWDSWGDLQLSSHPTAFTPNYSPLLRYISCSHQRSWHRIWPWLCFVFRESSCLASGFAAAVGFGWLVWLLNYLRSSSQGCSRTSELHSHVLLLQDTGEDVEKTVSWEGWTAFL